MVAVNSNLDSTSGASLQGVFSASPNLTPEILERFGMRLAVNGAVREAEKALGSTVRELQFLRTVDAKPASAPTVNHTQDRATKVNGGREE